MVATRFTSIKVVEPEADLSLNEANATWWESLQRLEPFGQGFEIPTFELRHVENVAVRSKRSPTKVMLKRGEFSWPAEFGAPRHPNPRPLGEGGNARVRQRMVATPQATPKDTFPFKWMIHEG